MIRKTQKHTKKNVRHGSFSTDVHTEKYLITTWWFLFIPVYISKELQASTL